MRPYGRIFFRGFSQGIPGPHRSRGRGLRPFSFAAIETRAKGKESQVMYCSTNGNHVEVREDDGRIVRRLPPFRGSVESAYMSGNDKVVITYTDVQNNLSPHPRYTELYSTDGRMIRRTRC